ncbi:hypothetical protein [Flavobacterium orientale]|uniref:hypothetical protein n=1 Tax=Flavobacterium orientale TaxID=1756020 RepID=UPI0016699745|nr:hypothetical protein [Flavobacterium orientale]
MIQSNIVLIYGLGSRCIIANKRELSAGIFPLAERCKLRESLKKLSLRGKFCGLLSVAINQHQAITNITKHSIEQRRDSVFKSPQYYASFFKKSAYCLKVKYFN